jgi:hypothetical protein
LSIGTNNSASTGVTPNAIRQRVQKIKNNAKLVTAHHSIEVKVNNTGGSSSNTKRPVASSGKKATSFDDDLGGPTKKLKFSKTNGIKKAKTSARARATKIKSEHKVDDESPNESENEDAASAKFGYPELEAAEDVGMHLDGEVEDIDDLGV